MNKSKFRPAFFKALILLVLSLGAVVMFYPFAYMILSSFKFNPEIVKMPPTFFPETPTLSNYSLVFNENHFGRFFFNSVWLTILKTGIILYSSALFGYVFAKIPFKGKEALFLFVLATMMIPWPVTLVPLYQLMSWLGWVGKYTSLIIPSMFSTFGIYMMRQFMGSIPNELIVSTMNSFIIFSRMFSKFTIHGNIVTFFIFEPRHIRIII